MSDDVSVECCPSCGEEAFVLKGESFVCKKCGYEEAALCCSECGTTLPESEFSIQDEGVELCNNCYDFKSER